MLLDKVAQMIVGPELFPRSLGRRKREKTLKSGKSEIRNLVASQIRHSTARFPAPGREGR